MKRFSVICTRGRDQWLADLVEQLLLQHTTPVVVDNNPEGIQLLNQKFIRTTYDKYDEDFNYSEAMNVGLDLVAQKVEEWESGEYIVACLNDDISIPHNFMDEMQLAIEKQYASVAYPDQHGVLGFGELEHYRKPGTITDHSRKMPGFAHVADGLDGLRFDESMKIWYSDNDYEMCARQNGGTVMVGGVRVEHHDANGNFTRRPYWQEQASRDRETFRNKWGFYAWT